QPLHHRPRVNERQGQCSRALNNLRSPLQHRWLQWLPQPTVNWYQHRTHGLSSFGFRISNFVLSSPSFYLPCIHLSTVGSGEGKEGTVGVAVRSDALREAFAAAESSGQARLFEVLLQGGRDGAADDEAGRAPGIRALDIADRAPAAPGLAPFRTGSG